MGDNNTTYIYDINAIIDYVFSDSDDKNAETEITENYTPDTSGDMSLVNRTIHEVRIVVVIQVNRP